MLLEKFHHSDEEGEAPEAAVEEKEKATPAMEKEKAVAVAIATKAGTQDPVKGAGAGAVMPSAAAPVGKKGALVGKENRDVGSVGINVYFKYVKAGGGVIAAAFIVVLLVVSQISRVANDLWLAMWSDEAAPTCLNFPVFLGGCTGFYILGYFLLSLLQAIIVFVRNFTMTFSGIRSAKILHNAFLKSILGSPMVFFDTTPIGRVMNRFSKDIATLDTTLMSSMRMYLNLLSQTIATVIVLAILTPPFIFPLIIVAFLYYYVQQYYNCTSRELKRLDSIARSPLYAHFSESLMGAATLRAYGMVPRYCEDNEKRVNHNHRAHFVNMASNRWLSVRLEVIGALLIFGVAISAVLWKDSGYLTPGLAGLAITYAIVTSGLLSFGVRMATQVETDMTSVERVLEYSCLPQEVTPEKVTVPAAWPTSGAITFTNVSMRYRPELPLVLKDMSIEIQPHEKIGIVGRTGSGKSSMTLLLFRMVEVLQGTIAIDGIDISRVDLTTLRQRVSIIPQDPFLFTGTVRRNLDPFDMHSDQEVWTALERCHMKDAIENMDGQLQGVVEEHGQNFSVGQRQLLCVGRALLKKTSVLIMDEATAAIDMHTDALIQRTVRECFADRTTLTIAHRLATIMDSTRILVMDNGNVAEFDTPSALLDQEKSALSGMVNATGAASAKFLRRLACGEINVADNIENLIKWDSALKSGEETDLEDIELLPDPNAQSHAKQE